MWAFALINNLPDHVIKKYMLQKRSEIIDGEASSFHNAKLPV